MFAKTGEGYRYGFNGMERDNETKGYGNDLSTFFRGYDPRIARWKSVDPVTKAMESAYVGFGNNPVLFVDPRGDVTESAPMSFDMKYSESLFRFGSRMTNEEMHRLFDVLGMEPTFAGPWFDGVNCAWYAIEGDWENAKISGIAIIPIVGDFAKGAKFTKIILKNATKSGKARYILKYTDDTGEVFSKNFLKPKTFDEYAELLEQYDSWKIAETIWEVRKNGNKLMKTRIKDAGLALDVPWQAHHLIPAKLIGESPLLRQAIEQGFDFNGTINGMAISKTRHMGRHPDSYNKGVMKIIDKVQKNNPKYSPKEIMDEVTKQVRKKVDSKPDKRINEIF